MFVQQTKLCKQTTKNYKIKHSSLKHTLWRFGCIKLKGSYLGRQFDLNSLRTQEHNVCLLYFIGKYSMQQNHTVNTSPHSWLGKKTQARFLYKKIKSISNKGYSSSTRLRDSLWANHHSSSTSTRAAWRFCRHCYFADICKKTHFFLIIICVRIIYYTSSWDILQDKNVLKKEMTYTNL